MPRYVVTVTAQFAPVAAVNAELMERATGGEVRLLAPDIAAISLSRRARDADCAAERAMADIHRFVAPQLQLTRPPTWVARRTGLRGLLTRLTRGRGGGSGDDDGLGGVREPRRPHPPVGSTAIALDPPTVDN